MPHIRGNVGFVFTRSDLVEIRDKLLENKVRAPARPGAIAPCPVVIPAQNTGLGPEKTSFFQALSIPTKISKGTIEIIVSKLILTIFSIHYTYIYFKCLEWCAYFKRRWQSWSFWSNIVEHVEYFSIFIWFSCTDGIWFWNYLWTRNLRYQARRFIENFLNSKFKFLY